MILLRTTAILVLVSLASGSQGRTIAVRKDGTGDFTVIQHALDAAASGDTVLIGPGEYTETTMVRLPGWAHDIESYAHLRADDVTVIGAGADLTVIGPESYSGNGGTYSPAGISYSATGGFVRISDLCVRNCYYGVGLIGILYLERCHILDNALGLSWDPSGSGGHLRDATFSVTAAIADPISSSIGNGGFGANITIDNCLFDREVVLRSIDRIDVRNSEFRGLSLYAGTVATLQSCASVGANVGISLALGADSYCEISDSILNGTSAAAIVSQSAPNSRLIATNCRLDGGTQAVVKFGYTAGPCTINGCDLVKGTGPIVLCEPSGSSIAHDLRNNYWGTAEDATIRSWIIDHIDNPSIGATVLYSPFAGQSVPTESTTWGDLKATYR